MQTNNFNVLRLLFAFFVFWEHAYPIFLNTGVQFNFTLGLFGTSCGSFGIDAFFFVSGFLVSNSYANSSSMISFFIKRFLRIYPAFFVVIVVTFLCGSLLTSNSFSAYFTHPTTYNYLRNLWVFRDLYYLPGVFETRNHLNAVNGSIWSIQYECFCYLMLPLIAVLVFRKTKKHVWISVYLFVLLVLYFAFQSDLETMVIPIFGLTLKSLMVPFIYFSFGIFCFVWHMKLKKYLVYIGGIALLLMIVQWSSGVPKLAQILLVVSTVYCVAFLPLPRYRFPDISYGFYLYAFPIQQVVYSFLGEQLNFEGLVVLSLVLIALAGYASHKWIEAPFLGLKEQLA